MLFPSAENALYDPSIIAEPKRKESAPLLLWRQTAHNLSISGTVPSESL